ncbi:aminoglycoside phosphotransferase family protein [Micromonospora rifamycinica]|uniref:Phosphotransferase enzyme family protein n=1 Tax=Micromonospora rifamycinica TaxID=291594 RepID=A0A109IEY3_9ACTN|nr:aminoglycoside phosphotransferase family protein [Micromonospora rifamycinica]KWV29319.1 aminoglycoside phosphotransferase [Micromonospora rifamycinica]SCG80850.1 Phosphotransferase enzyme family protein [Micromonospora rifamycinica]
MDGTGGGRIGWAELPRSVRLAVEQIIGDRVVEARSQPGGYSPGTADRVRTAGGRRAFVKAVSPAQNPQTPRMHRAEARHTAALPGSAPTPRLLGWHDDGEWVALVLTDVEGRHPYTPWRAAELDSVLRALAALAGALTPNPVPDVPTAAERLAHDFAGWRRIVADPPPRLDPWAAAHLTELCAAADRGLAALTGDTLCHLDVRADNLLIGPDGSVTVVDWPWACRGPAWLDTALLLVNVQLHGGHDTEALVRGLPLTADVDPAVLTGFYAGLAGFFTDSARRPPPPGIPTVRHFQQAQADALLPWLTHRLPQ